MGRAEHGAQCFWLCTKSSLWLRFVYNSPMLDVSQQRPSICSHTMSDDQPCGRPALAVERMGSPVCIMHSHDPNKDAGAFDDEIRAIRSGASRYCRKTSFYDFRGFIFVTAEFGEMLFLHQTSFIGARFIHKANFSGVTFRKDVSFEYATFDQGADFNGATFTQAASFARAHFGHERIRVSTASHKHDSHHARVPGVNVDTGAPANRPAGAAVRLWDELPSATFCGAQFQKPAASSFFQVNHRCPEGLLARFVNCEELDKLDFTDVHWFRRGNRMVLLDELDIRCGYTRQPELVAKAYRQLVNNFEKVRSYDLAEDCFIGAMEMKRLDPRKQALGSLGRWLSATNLYRLLSNYGSSYARAFFCLLLFLVLFALLFPAFGLIPSNAPQAGTSAREPTISWTRALARPHRTRELWSTFEDGFWASIEAATFQKNPTLKPADERGEHLRISEDIIIPGQLALFLLALRRRFRR